MCGIVGIAGPQEADWIDRMNAIQAHRGPDDDGVHRAPEAEVSLAMRRLSILDLECGAQPMSNEDGSVWIVFNGEIFNAPDLRPSLIERGHRFATQNSDTEVLVHLWEEQGEEMLGELNGMFAFAIYDARCKVLFAARDRSGIKPLYYHHDAAAGRLAFASEMKSLLELPTVGRSLDRQSIFHYLSLQYVPPPGTIFRDIRKLPAGHRFRWDLESRRLQVDSYWRPRFVPEQVQSREELVRTVRTEFESAVGRWTLSDVPIAVSLSGGIDSAAVTAVVAQRLGSGVPTWTLGFDHAGANDERSLARQVADKWQTDHHEIVLSPNAVLDDLDEMVWHLDEPYAGGLPSWYVFREMGREVKVAMTGSGGDELFGNYRKWRVYESRLRKLRSIARDGKRRGGAQFRYPEGSLYPHYLADREKRQILGPGFQEMLATEAMLQGLCDSSPSPGDPRNVIPWIDFQMQLPEEFLLMTDRFSMAHGVEARVPFLDHEFVDAVLRIPSDDRTDSERPKQLLIDAVRDLLPTALTEAPKQGFVLPLDSWLRGPLRPRLEAAFQPDRLRAQAIFREDLHALRIRPFLDGRTDDTQQVWTLLMFQLWWDMQGADLE